MLYYEYNLKCTAVIAKKLAKDLAKNKKKAEAENKFLSILNSKLNEAKATLGAEHLGGYECNIIGLNADKEFEFTLKLVLGKKPSTLKPDDFDSKLAETVTQALHVRRVALASKEIVPNDLNNKQMECFGGQGGDFLSSLELPSSTFGEFQLAEDIIKADDNIILEAALEEAEELFLDDSFKEELKRIFSEENSRSFVAHPVHYLLELDQGSNKERTLQLLTKCLYKNRRLLSCRLDTFFSIDNNIDDVSNFSDFFAMVEGSTVVLDTNSDSNDNGRLIELLKQKICGMANNTLFVVVSYKGSNCYGKALVKSLEGKLDFVQLGNINKVELPIGKVLAKLAEKNGLGELYASNPPEVADRQEGYSREEVNIIFNSWAEQVAQRVAYKAYADRTFTTVNKDTPSKHNALVELNKLIGLNTAKATAKELLAAAKINKLRQQKGLSCENRALHMLFTGNPGTAKTTFARLIAKILVENNIIKSDKFVECGRGDLVGQYVGWTARCVKQKFNEAKGGVLFIDEAYSLIGEGKDFGAEAISTIVQEMENHRDDVVVIFAGYPDKMEEFLKQNEGLRSRIPYHMHFPDYNEEELLAILQMLTAERGYQLTEGFTTKCREHVREAVKGKDFGNGRYMRNLLEKAIAKQAMRITEGYELSKVTKKLLLRLEAEDFPVVLQKPARKAATMGIKL